MGGAPLGVTSIDLGGDVFVNMERDRLGSLRRTRVPDFGNLPFTQREYGPYGESYNDNGMDLGFGYTGHLNLTQDSDYPLYYAPFRMYSPKARAGRHKTHSGWLMDPIYTVRRGNPTNLVDPFGGSSTGCLSAAPVPASSEYATSPTPAPIRTWAIMHGACVKMPARALGPIGTRVLGLHDGY